MSSGDLSEMAAKGTTIPKDSATPRIIKSVPRPDQIPGSDDIGADSLHGAADNASDVPRRYKDTGASGEVLTGTGDQLPAEVETKRLNLGANNPLAKGHARYDKHSRDKESHLDQLAGSGAEVDVPPGQEELSQDEIRSAGVLDGRK